MSKFLGRNKKTRTVTTVNNLTGEVHSYTNTVQERNGANFNNIFGLVLTLFLGIILIRVLSGNLNDFSFSEAFNRLDSYDLNGGIPYLKKVFRVSNDPYLDAARNKANQMDWLMPGLRAVGNLGIFLLNSILYIVSFVDFLFSLIFT